LHNQKRQGALHNQYNAIYMCKDTDLIVIVDGDDALHDNEVLSFLNTIYSNSDIWLTYGQWVDWITRQKGWCVPMPADIVERNAFREFTNNPSHLRTFYAGLFKQIKKEDLIYQGDFFQMSGDVAAMFPMIEMARKNHFLFIDKPLLRYNSINPINDHKVVKGLQYQLDVEIRKRQRYEPIETPFLSQNGGL
jgi:glycosyltransferase involved in cell wall biosynthesis